MPRVCTQFLEVGTVWFFLRRNQTRCPEHDSEMTNGNGSRMYSLGNATDCGMTAKDNRLFIEAGLWIARTGSPWRD